MKVKLEDDGEDNSELIEEIEDSFIEEYIPLPGQYEINEYRIIDYSCLPTGSLSHPVRTLRAIYSGNSEPPYWALLHIFPLYCKRHTLGVNTDKGGRKIMTKYREILRLKSLDSVRGTSHKVAVYPETQSPRF